MVRVGPSAVQNAAKTLQFSSILKAEQPSRLEAGCFFLLCANSE